MRRSVPAAAAVPPATPVPTATAVPPATTRLHGDLDLTHDASSGMKTALVDCGLSPRRGGRASFVYGPRPEPSLPSLGRGKHGGSRRGDVPLCRHPVCLMISKSSPARVTVGAPGSTEA